MSGVNAVASRKESVLDTIMKGVAVARDVYGIKTAYDDNERKDAAAEDIQKEKARFASGKLNKGEQIELGTKGFIAAPKGQTPDFNATDAESGGMLGYVKQKTAPKIQPKVAVHTVENGVAVTKFVDPNEGGVYISPKAAGEGVDKANKREFDALPPPNQEIIKDLAKSNANKISIANAIHAVVAPENWSQLTEDEKLQQGRQLIKTLNSTEGKDAVGAEEAKRLAGKLQYAVGNFTNDNPVQFGRDIEGFVNDARITHDGIVRGVQANEAEIEKRYGHAPVIKPAGDVVPLAKKSGANRPQPTAEDAAALEWLNRADPKDPAAVGVRAALKAKGLL